MTTRSSRLIDFLRFLGKVKFTTILLLGGAVIMTIGTILESRGSREVAWSAIYGTAWFDLFLFLIALNLIIAVVNRLPIKRHQWPFVVTHFAIVLLLAGAWISRTYGYEGRLMVYEGERDDQLYLDASEIRVSWRGATNAAGPAQGVDARFPLPEHGRMAGRILQREGEGVPGIEIAEYVPNGIFAAELRDAPDGTPGVAVRLTKGQQAVEHWLMADDPRFARKDLGPLTIEFRRTGPDAPRNPRLREETIRGADVLISPADGSEPVRIALPDRLGESVPIGPDIVARVRQYFTRARIAQGEVLEDENGELNPAAIVELSVAGRTEVHTLFSRYPDFGSVQGHAPDQPSVAVVGLEITTGVEKPEVEILLGPNERLSVQLTTESGVRPLVAIEIGESLVLSEIGVELQLQRFLAKARPEFGVKPSDSGSQAGQAWVRLEAHMNGMQNSIWLRHGGGQAPVIQLARGRLQASYGPQRRSLPFSIALDQFELITHPGSNRPAEYRSRVRVEQTAANLPPRDEVISMNRPLDVAGFRLFQSSYRLAEAGRPNATVLSVSYDPGVPIVYASFGLLILGIAWGLRVPRPKVAHASQPKPARDPGTSAEEAKRSLPSAPGTERASVRRTAGRILGVLLALLAGLSPTADAATRSIDAAARLPVEETRGWAILADGRAKPLLTYANEYALAITGREALDGLSSLELLWGYVLSPDEFATRPYIRIDSPELKAKFGLDPSEKRFAFSALIDQPAVREAVGLALQRKNADQPLSRLDRDALEVYTKLERIEGLTSGAALTIVPSVDEHDHWLAPSQLGRDGHPSHPEISQAFARLATAHATGDAPLFSEAARSLSVMLRSIDPQVYPSESQLRLELFYDDFNAFGKAWKLYLTGFLVILLLGFSERPWGYALGLTLIAGGFAAHSMGLGTRWAIADRAPVSDMYESLVFMGWGVIAIGLAAEAVNRKRFLALAAGLMGFVCLAFAENLPIDSAINPLVPVLAHTYWLSVHVMTVMLSYSAFALAMVLGHVMIVVQVFRRQRLQLLGTLSQLLYKTMQIGVLFLAAGIAFGAIWANESWGRYWGWDPKETWSLITFFVYLAIIHARFAGWLRYFGLAASAILGFLAVVMTYYGVNFILAAGMHSYGFSEGGQFYAVLYGVIEIAFVAGGRVWSGLVASAQPLTVAAAVDSDSTQA